MGKEEIREGVWREFRKVAKPDARFHWDFNNFIADFVGSVEATERLRDAQPVKDASYVFSTPDNSLTSFRASCMRDKKDLLVSTSGIERGFFLLEGGVVPEEMILYGATLDGMDYVGTPLTLSQVQERGPIEVLVTGASAVTTDGIRLGKGHGWFDLEWAIFSELGLVAESTPVFVLVHDSQVLSDVAVDTSPYDVAMDYIVTPTRILRTNRSEPRPNRVFWDALEPGMLESIEPLRELSRIQSKGPETAGE